jgi:hypothetical protein
VSIRRAISDQLNRLQSASLIECETAGFRSRRLLDGHQLSKKGAKSGEI